MPILAMDEVSNRSVLVRESGTMELLNTSEEEGGEPEPLSAPAPIQAPIMMSSKSEGAESFGSVGAEAEAEKGEVVLANCEGGEEEALREAPVEANSKAEHEMKLAFEDISSDADEEDDDDDVDTNCDIPLDLPAQGREGQMNVVRKPETTGPQLFRKLSNEREPVEEVMAWMAQDRTASESSFSPAAPRAPRQVQADHEVAVSPAGSEKMADPRGPAHIIIGNGFWRSTSKSTTTEVQSERVVEQKAVRTPMPEPLPSYQGFLPSWVRSWYCCTSSDPAPTAYRDPEEVEWEARQQQTGAAGRLVNYDLGERPREDFALRGGGLRRLMVAAVREGGKAFEAGVRAGDVLVSVNGSKDFEGKEADQVHASLRAPVTLVFLGFVGKLQAEVRLNYRQKIVGITSYQQAFSGKTTSPIQVVDTVVFQPSRTPLLLATQRSGLKQSKDIPAAVHEAEDEDSDDPSDIIDIDSLPGSGLLPLRTSAPVPTNNHNDDINGIYELKGQEARKLVRRALARNLTSASAAAAAAAGAAITLAGEGAATLNGFIHHRFRESTTCSSESVGARAPSDKRQMTKS